MKCHILTKKGTIITLGVANIFTELETQLHDCKELFLNFDVEIHKRLRMKIRGCEGSKPSLQHWEDLLEEDEEFS